MGREVRYRTYFILRIDHRLFRNVAVRDLRHNSDHYLVLLCLHSAPLREHTNYLRRRKQTPLRTLTTLKREDGPFAALQRVILKPKSQEARKTRGSQWPRGGLLTRESPLSGILQETSPTFGGWTAQ